MSAAHSPTNKYTVDSSAWSVRDLSAEPYSDDSCNVKLFVEVDNHEAYCQVKLDADFVKAVGQLGHQRVPPLHSCQSLTG